MKNLLFTFALALILTACGQEKSNDSSNSDMALRGFAYGKPQIGKPLPRPYPGGNSCNGQPGCLGQPGRR